MVSRPFFISLAPELAVVLGAVMHWIASTSYKVCFLSWRLISNKELFQKDPDRRRMRMTLHLRGVGFVKIWRRSCVKLSLIKVH